MSENATCKRPFEGLPNGLSSPLDGLTPACRRRTGERMDRVSECIGWMCGVEEQTERWFAEQRWRRGESRPPRATIAAFHRRLVERGVCVRRRTLYRWVEAYVQRGVEALIDHRGRSGRGRVQVDSLLWGKLLAGVQAGRSVAGTYRELLATAEAEGLVLPSLRLLQLRVTELRCQAKRSPHLLAMPEGLN